MSYTDRHYRILLVSTEDKFIKEVSALLQDERYELDNARSASDAENKLLKKTYDIVMINAPLSDDPGTKLCTAISRSSGTIVAVYASNDVFDDIQSKVSAQGVFVLHKPSSKVMVSQAISLMICARDRMRVLEQKVDKAESKLEEFRVVNKAKCMLIEHEGMSEADAHRYIEKKSMDAGVAKKLVAQIIINDYMK